MPRIEQLFVQLVEKKASAMTLGDTLRQIILRASPSLATFVRNHTGQDTPFGDISKGIINYSGPGNLYASTTRLLTKECELK